MTLREPIVLRDIGSFHIGGRVVEISGKPSETAVLSPGGIPATFDPNGAYQVEQMYVQYFLPEKRRGKYPLLLWHGGGLTGVTYETTPDGRDGWLNMFIRAGFDVYISDAVERGRSGFAPPDVWEGKPQFVTKANPFWRHRIGEEWDADPAKMKQLPGNQFPVEAYDNFTRQMVPRWTGTDDAIIAAYTALVDKVGPCIVLCHSQGCGFAFRVAQARPHLFKALIAIEPAVGGDADRAASLKNVPVLVVYGDFIAQHERWAKMKQAGLDYVAALRAAGGSVDVVNLPDAGIRGNSHMLMMDKNNGEIAALIGHWLSAHGFIAETWQRLMG
jgi:pimeloyl-ACP methyl ester carboxylesterase